MTSSRLAVLVTGSLLAFATPSAAQSLSDVLTFLLTNESVQTGSGALDRNAAQATRDTIARALLTNLATLPLPTSADAFVYQLNPDLGTMERGTQSFGPFFVERAQVAGRGQASFGLAFQELRFGSLDGMNLRDGSLVTTANQFTNEQTPFEVDRLTLDIQASVATLYGSLGVTDRLEVGLAVPLVSLRVDGSLTDVYRGRTFTQATASAHTIGLADLVLRTKYKLFGEASSGVSAAADVRLPTGSQQNLLGAGSPSLTVLGVGSVDFGRFSTHGNAGMTVGGLARELSYSGAVAVAAGARVTIVGEVLGRWIDSPGQIAPVSSPNASLAGVQTIRLMPAGSTFNTVTLVPGFKWNLSDTWILAGNISIPLTAAGLTAPFTPFVGLDYVLGP
jgi:hypothetical protein